MKPNHLDRKVNKIRREDAEKLRMAPRKEEKPPAKKKGKNDKKQEK